MSAAGGRGAGGGQDHQSDQTAAPVISGEQAAALLRKYQLLAVWRRSKDLGGETPPPRGDFARAPSPSAPDATAAGAQAHRAALRSLSREFPGALRELDVLGLPEISRRIVRLTLLLNGTGQAPAAPPGFHPSTHGGDKGEDDDLWMPLIAAYHGLMRVALTVKRDSARTRVVSAADVAKAQAAVQASCGFSIDESFVQAAVRPPAGRLAVLVLTALAQRFRLPAGDISRLLFPPRRPSPYDL